MAQISTRKCDLCEKDTGKLFCYECRHFLCQLCKNFHDKIQKRHTVTDSHNVDKLTLSVQLTCEEHKEDFAHFCGSCECLICSSCVTTVHRGHSLTHISEVVSKARENVKLNIGKLKKKIKTLTDLIEPIKATKFKKIKDESEHFSSEVKTTSEHIISIVNFVKEIGMTRASDFLDLGKQQLEFTIAKLEKVYKEHASVSSQLEHVLQLEHDTAFFLNQSTITKQIEYLDDIPVIEEPNEIGEFNKEEFVKSVMKQVQSQYKIELSKIAGIQLTKGNSDIADLGDVNRPTKLAEKWSNLYTDEWTEAYDELGMNKTNKNENCKFEKELCSIALKCYSICLDIERKQTKDIKTHTWDIACCLHQQQDQLVSAAQTTQYDRGAKGDFAKKNMGDSLSIPEKWKHDPNYSKARDTLKTADKDVRRLVNGFIVEQDRLDDENSKLQKNNEELQTKNDEYRHHQFKLQGEIKKLRDDIHKLLNKSKPHPKMPLERSNLENLATDKMVEYCLQEQVNLTEMNNKLKRENESFRRECQILSNEKESALSRLSKIACIQLTKGNSDIADLSDVNRPTQLAEKWSNLYTEEWTEAYDELGMNKTNKNEHFKFEKELCSIALAATMYPQDAKVEGRQFSVKMLAIQKCMEELIHERRKYDKQLLEYVKQEAVRHFEKYTKPGSKGDIIRYVEHCTELCWIMVIRNPQMVLVHNQMVGKPFDRDMFSVYTKKGAVVDFVIWPALILHQNGPILAKGTIQGKDNDKTEIAQGKTDKSETKKESIRERSVIRGKIPINKEKCEAM